MRLAKFLEQSLRAISGQVACSHTSLWVFDGVDADRSLRCLRAHDSVADRVRPGPFESIERGAQQLFEVLSQNSHVVGDMAGCHEALRRLAEHPSFGAGAAARPAAQIAAAFSMNGRLLGALVCTQPTCGAAWSQRQVITLTKASSSVALSLSRDGADAFEALLERPRCGVA